MNSKTPYFKILVLIFLNVGILSCSSTKKIAHSSTTLLSYDYETASTDGWQLIRQDTLWGFISDNRTEIISPQFLWADQFKDSLAVVETKEGYTYILAKGEILRQRFPYAYRASEGLAAASKKGKWGYLNAEGKWKIKPQYDWALPFSEGLAVVAKGNRYGFIDNSGEFVLKPKYHYISSFKNGRAIVRRNGRFGLIDSLGNELIPTQYKFITPHKEGYQVFIKAQFPVAEFDRDGNPLTKVKGTIKKFETDSNRIPERRNGLWGMKDRLGNLVIPNKYNKKNLFRLGVAVLELNHKAGVLNADGKVIVPFRYKMIYVNERKRLFEAQTDTEMDVYDFEGRRLLHSNYKQITNLYTEGSYLWITKDGKVGVLNWGFKEIAPPIYEKIRPDFHHRRRFKLKGKYGFMDGDFKVVIPRKYTKAGDFHKGIAPVEQNGESFYIDKNGKQISPREQQKEEWKKANEKQRAKEDKIREDYYMRILDFST